MPDEGLPERAALSELARDDVRQAARKIRGRLPVPAVAIAPLGRLPQGIDPLGIYRPAADELQLHVLLYPVQESGSTPVMWVVIARDPDVSPSELLSAVRRISG